jgi:hypothetical protein
MPMGLVRSLYTDLLNSCRTQSFSWHIPWADWLLRRYARVHVVDPLSSFVASYSLTCQAHILAYRDRGQCDISDRIRAIFFLATPHRGSDYAALLNNVLKVSGYAGISSSREYINNLAVGSKSTQLINEEFASCIAHLTIFSFYETLQTSIGVKSTIIVSKDSAVLGEQLEPLSTSDKKRS